MPMSAALEERTALFMPLVYRLAARLEQVRDETFESDDASFAHCIRAAKQLFGLDAVLVHFDHDVTLRVDASRRGDPGALSELDVEERTRRIGARAARLKAELGDTTYILGVVPSISTMLNALGALSFDKSAQKWAERALRGIANEQLTAGVDGVLLVRDTSIGVLTDEERRQLLQLNQMTSYFEVPLIILALTGGDEYWDVLPGGAPAWRVVEGHAAQGAREIPSLPVDFPAEPNAEDATDLSSRRQQPLTTWGEVIDRPAWMLRNRTNQGTATQEAPVG